MENIKKSLIETLLVYGAMNAKISKKQKMKLREWIIPNILQEYNDGKIGTGNGEIMNIKDLLNGPDGIEKLLDLFDIKYEKDYGFYKLMNGSNTEKLVNNIKEDVKIEFTLNDNYQMAYLGGFNKYKVKLIVPITKDLFKSN